ncbi:MAG: vitamin B12 dependent-methionine synthase activation domain-containing protein [Christensenellales bacterium]|jgi:hypothetical protein
MERIVLDAFAFDITGQELLKTLRMEDDQDEDALKVCRMLEEALACARPKAVYCIAAIEQKGEDFVTVEGHKIFSPLVRKNLDQVSRIVPYVATCGLEVESWSKQYDGDIFEQFWADEIKKLLLYRAIRALNKEVKSKYFASGDMSAMSPGSLPEWPITRQTELFDVIGDVGELAGVSLTDSFLMIPSKSVSGFFFSSETHYENCQLCPIPNCPNRRAPYQKDVGA